MTLTLERRQQDEATAGFHQSWFPLALADDVKRGQVVGRDFLGTRVILYRDPAGRAVVQGAFCPHLGADLSVGQVVEGRIRCAYHHWTFDCAGACVDTRTSSQHCGACDRACAGGRDRSAGCAARPSSPRSRSCRARRP